MGTALMVMDFQVLQIRAPSLGHQQSSCIYYCPWTKVGEQVTPQSHHPVGAYRLRRRAGLRLNGAANDNSVMPHGARQSRAACGAARKARLGSSHLRHGDPDLQTRGGSAAPVAYM